MNFGDGAIDNERFGMSRFIYFNNPGSNPAGPYMFDPEFAPDYYNYLRGRWKDSTIMVYGGYGHESAGGYGPEANFMFPGESDTCFWGTNGEEPDGPVNWTEETAGNEPGDRRGLGVTGPFTFEAHSKEQLDIAYVWARSETDGLSSGDLLMNHVNAINTMAQNNELELEEPQDVIGIDNEFQRQHPSIQFYPNPSNGFLNIKGIEENINFYDVYDLTGRLMKSGRSNSHRLNLKNLNTGFYIIKIYSDSKIYSGKFFMK